HGLRSGLETKSRRASQIPEVMSPDRHPGANDLAVEARDVHVAFNGQAVLRGVNLRVPRGQLVALIGPNGSGKTTLLRALLGLQTIASGDIRLFGRNDLRTGLARTGYV